MVLRHSNESRRTLGKFFVGTVQFGLSTKPYGFLVRYLWVQLANFMVLPYKLFGTWVRYLLITACKRWCNRANLIYKRLWVRQRIKMNQNTRIWYLVPFWHHTIRLKSTGEEQPGTWIKMNPKHSSLIPSSLQLTKYQFEIIQIKCPILIWFYPLNLSFPIFLYASSLYCCCF